MYILYHYCDVRGYETCTMIACSEDKRLLEEKRSELCNLPHCDDPDLLMYEPAELKIEEVELIEMGFSPDWVSPPGDTMLCILEERGWTVERFAREMDLTVRGANDILDGNSDGKISEALAGKLSSVLGSTPGFWLRREVTYRAGAIRSAHL